MMEVKPAPLGVTPPSASTVTTSKLDVCFAGTLSGWSELAQGYSYYATTKGDLIQGDALYGRDVSTEFAYLYDSASNTYVTVDGKVGFAPSATSLYVHVQE